MTILITEEFVFGHGVHERYNVIERFKLTWHKLANATFANKFNRRKRQAAEKNPGQGKRKKT